MKHSGLGREGSKYGIEDYLGSNTCALAVWALDAIGLRVCRALSGGSGKPLLPLSSRSERLKGISSMQPRGTAAAFTSPAKRSEPPIRTKPGPETAKIPALWSDFSPPRPPRRSMGSTQLRLRRRRPFDVTAGSAARAVCTSNPAAIWCSSPWRHAGGGYRRLAPSGATSSNTRKSNAAS